MGLVEWVCLGCGFGARDYSGKAKCSRCGKWGYDKE